MKREIRLLPLLRLTSLKLPLPETRRPWSERRVFLNLFRTLNPKYTLIALHSFVINHQIAKIKASKAKAVKVT
jgi:hypothetical protein